MVKTRTYLLGVGLVACCYSMLTLAGDAQDLITQDINKTYSSVDNGAKNLEIQLRKKIENLQIDGISRGLYTQNMAPGITPQASVVLNHFIGVGSGEPGFCSIETNNESSQYSCQSDPLLQHGDLKISGILSNSFLADDRMASLFINNVIEPFPDNQFSDSTAISSTNIRDGKTIKKLSQKMSEQAIYSIARQPFAEMVARRTVKNPQTNLSLMQTIEKAGVSKFLNDGWANQVANLGNGAATSLDVEKMLLELNKELVMFQAFHSYMEVQRFKQMERVEALLSALVIRAQAQEKMGKEALSAGENVSTGG